MERSSAFFRLASRLCLGLLLITTLTTPLFVQAQGDAPSIKDKAGIPGYPAVTISENLPERINAVYENLRWELIGAGTMAFMNAMQTFLASSHMMRQTTFLPEEKDNPRCTTKKDFKDTWQTLRVLRLANTLRPFRKRVFFKRLVLTCVDHPIQKRC